MYKIRKATGVVTYDLFFYLCVIFGTFFVLNLMIAVQFSYLQSSLQENDRKINDDSDEMLMQEEPPSVKQEKQERTDLDNFGEAFEQSANRERS